MNFKGRAEKIVSGFELVTVLALQVLVILLIAGSTVLLFVLGFAALRTRALQIGSIGDLLYAVQRSLAGILIVVLALELLSILTAYLREHIVRLEVILIVAIIAVSRQVILIDFQHSANFELLGLSAVTISLTAGYYLVKKAQQMTPSSKPDDAP